MLVWCNNQWNLVGTHLVLVWGSTRVLFSSNSRPKWSRVWNSKISVFIYFCQFRHVATTYGLYVGHTVCMLVVCQLLKPTMMDIWLIYGQYTINIRLVCWIYGLYVEHAIVYGLYMSNSKTWIFKHFCLNGR